MTNITQDWRRQMRERLRSVDELRNTCPEIELPDDTDGGADMAVTPYYMSALRQASPAAQAALLRMCVPTTAEKLCPDFLRGDPHRENHHMPVPGLVHRYPDRALLIATHDCAVRCRHCMRKRSWWANSAPPSLDMPAAARYLSDHPGIRDVLISGGDPLCMETKALAAILSPVRAVPSIDIIRIGTRVPATLPMRIDAELVDALRGFHPLYINTHFNHPAELTSDATAACSRLADAGIPLGNQAVLMRGINDDVETLEALFRGLLRARVRPYYLFQCDLVSGVEHLRTRLSVGLRIMRELRQRLGGLGIPAFVVDAPGVGSKIPLLPDYIVARDDTSTTFRDPDGNTFVYPEPA
jgi:lysine 2,3-aminomutase